MFREWVKQIGRVHSVRIECQSFLPDWRPDRPYRQSYSARAEEGGVLRDLIHEIDYAAWIFGWPTACSGLRPEPGPTRYRSDEMAELLWTTTAGTVISVGLDYLSRMPHQHACQRKHGTLEWDGIIGRVKLELAERRRASFNQPDPRWDVAVPRPGFHKNSQ